MKNLIVATMLLICHAIAMAAPSCLPGMYGPQVGSADYSRTNEGWYGYGFCRNVDGSISTIVFACVHGSCLPIGTFAERVTNMKRGSNPVDTIKSSWDAEFANKCKSATGVLKTVCNQGLLAAMENYPWSEVKTVVTAPPEVWEVSPVSSGQRPSRKVVNGAVVTMASPIYVPQLSICLPNEAPTQVTTAGVWMAVVGQP